MGHVASQFDDADAVVGDAREVAACRARFSLDLLGPVGSVLNSLA